MASSSVMLSSPIFRLFKALVAKSTGSWPTKPISFRQLFTGSWCSGMPFTSTEPGKLRLGLKAPGSFKIYE